MKKRMQRLIVGAVLFAIALLVPAEPTALKFAVYLAAYLVIGYQVLRKALNNIKRGKIFDENFLMAVASVGAFVIGEYPEAVAVMLFYQIGELFEDYAVGKSRKSIRRADEYPSGLRESQSCGRRYQKGRPGRGQDRRCHHRQAR